MKTKKLFLLFLCIFLSVLMLAGCAGRHKIIINGDQSLIDKCPKSAKTGDTVTVTTVMAKGAVYNFECSTDYTMIREGVYEFVMPDHDVEISGYVSTVGVPGS